MILRLSITLVGLSSLVFCDTEPSNSSDNVEVKKSSQFDELVNILNITQKEGNTNKTEYIKSRNYNNTLNENKVRKKRGNDQHADNKRSSKKLSRKFREPVYRNIFQPKDPMTDSIGGNTRRSETSNYNSQNNTDPETQSAEHATKINKSEIIYQSETNFDKDKIKSQRLLALKALDHVSTIKETNNSSDNVSTTNYKEKINKRDIENQTLVSRENNENSSYIIETNDSNLINDTSTNNNNETSNKTDASVQTDITTGKDKLNSEDMLPLKNGENASKINVTSSTYLINNTSTTKDYNLNRSETENQTEITIEKETNIPKDSSPPKIYENASIITESNNSNLPNDTMKNHSKKNYDDHVTKENHENGSIKTILSEIETVKLAASKKIVGESKLSISKENEKDYIQNQTQNTSESSETKAPLIFTANNEVKAVDTNSNVTQNISKSDSESASTKEPIVLETIENNAENLKIYNNTTYGIENITEPNLAPNESLQSNDKANVTNTPNLGEANISSFDESITTETNVESKKLSDNSYDEKQPGAEDDVRMTRLNSLSNNNGLMQSNSEVLISQSNSGDNKTNLKINTDNSVVNITIESPIIPFKNNYNILKARQNTKKVKRKLFVHSNPLMTVSQEEPKSKEPSDSQIKKKKEENVIQTVYNLKVDPKKYSSVKHTGKEGDFIPYEVFEVDSDEDIFKTVNKKEEKPAEPELVESPQSYLVPIYNYDPKNAYFNPISLYDNPKSQDSKNLESQIYPKMSNSIVSEQLHDELIYLLRKLLNNIYHGALRENRDNGRLKQALSYLDNTINTNPEKHEPRESKHLRSIKEKITWVRDIILGNKTFIPVRKHNRANDRHSVYNLYSNHKDSVDSSETAHSFLQSFNYLTEKGSVPPLNETLGYNYDNITKSEEVAFAGISFPPYIESKIGHADLKGYMESHKSDAEDENLFDLGGISHPKSSDFGSIVDPDDGNNEFLAKNLAKRPSSSDSHHKPSSSKSHHKPSSSESHHKPSSSESHHKPSSSQSHHQPQSGKHHKILEKEKKLLHEKDKLIKEKDKLIEEKNRLVDEKEKIIEEEEALLNDAESGMKDKIESWEEDAKSVVKDKIESGEKYVESVVKDAESVVKDKIESVEKDAESVVKDTESAVTEAVSKLTDGIYEKKKETEEMLPEVFVESDEKGSSRYLRGGGNAVNKKVEAQITVLRDMVEMNNEYLEKYDWLGSAVNLQTALEKLSGLILSQEQHEHINLYDKELLHYVKFLYEKAQQDLSADLEDIENQRNDDPKEGHKITLQVNKKPLFKIEIDSSESDDSADDSETDDKDSQSSSDNNTNQSNESSKSVEMQAQTVTNLPEIVTIGDDSSMANSPNSSVDKVLKDFMSLNGNNSAEYDAIIVDEANAVDKNYSNISSTFDILTTTTNSGPTTETSTVLTTEKSIQVVEEGDVSNNTKNQNMKLSTIDTIVEHIKIGHENKLQNETINLEESIVFNYSNSESDLSSKKTDSSKAKPNVYDEYKELEETLEKLRVFGAMDPQKFTTAQKQALHTALENIKKVKSVLRTTRLHNRELDHIIDLANESLNQLNNRTYQRSYKVVRRKAGKTFTSPNNMKSSPTLLNNIPSRSGRTHFHKEFMRRLLDDVAIKGVPEAELRRFMENLQYYHDIRVFLDELRSSVDHLHNAIKHVALISTYKKQRWYTQLKPIYFKDASKKDLLATLLHMFAVDLFDKVEASAKNGIELDPERYVRNHRKEISETLESMKNVIQISNELKQLD